MISEAEAERRTLLAKEYSRLCMQREHTQMKKLCGIAKARDEALAELAEHWPKLHVEALKDDPTPYPIELPVVTETPAKL